MSTHPFYDPKNLTDNELQEKLYQCIEKQNHAHNMGMIALGESIEAVMYEIKMEQEKRLIDAEKDYNKQHNINPNEPITLGEIEELEPDAEKRNGFQ